MKKALWAASLLLVAGTASACGGDDAPSDASKEDFCGAAKEITGLETGKDVKDFAEKLEDVGTPEDMSDDERKGFDLFIETANKLKDDSTEEDATKLGEDLSADEEKDIEAFTTYLAKTCVKELQEVVPDAPTLPTDELPHRCPPTSCPPTSCPPTNCPPTNCPRFPSFPSPADAQKSDDLWGRREPLNP